MASTGPRASHGEPFPSLLAPNTRSSSARSSTASSPSKYYGPDQDGGIASGAVHARDTHVQSSLLTPEDAFAMQSTATARRLRSSRGASRNRQARPKRAWKKLLWVKQPCMLVGSDSVCTREHCYASSRRLTRARPSRPGQLHRPGHVS
jgi:hypothetical protein